MFKNFFQCLIQNVAVGFEHAQIQGAADEFLARDTAEGLQGEIGCQDTAVGIHQYQGSRGEFIKIEKNLT